MLIRNLFHHLAQRSKAVARTGRLGQSTLELDARANLHPAAGSIRPVHLSWRHRPVAARAKPSVHWVEMLHPAPTNGGKPTDNIAYARWIASSAILSLFWLILGQSKARAEAQDLRNGILPQELIDETLARHEQRKVLQQTPVQEYHTTFYKANPTIEDTHKV